MEEVLTVKELQGLLELLEHTSDDVWVLAQIEAVKLRLERAKANEE